MDELARVTTTLRATTRAAHNPMSFAEKYLAATSDAARHAHVARTTAAVEQLLSTLSAGVLRTVIPSRDVHSNEACAVCEIPAVVAMIRKMDGPTLLAMLGFDPADTRVTASIAVKEPPCTSWNPNPTTSVCLTVSRS
jgi:hypothetical protein